ncbi:unnamed protein product, partial [Nesidiocoris tenuis]
MNVPALYIFINRNPKTHRQSMEQYFSAALFVIQIITSSGDRLKNGFLGRPRKRMERRFENAPGPYRYLES